MNGYPHNFSPMSEKKHGVLTKQVALYLGVLLNQESSQALLEHWQHIYLPGYFHNEQETVVISDPDPTFR